MQSSLTISLPLELWTESIIPRSGNSVHHMQRLRAVNKKFRDKVDEQVLRIINCFQKNQNILPFGRIVQILDTEIDSTIQARETAASWILLVTVVEKRKRQLVMPDTCFGNIVMKGFLHWII